MTERTPDGVTQSPKGARPPQPTPRRTALGHAVADRTRLLQRLSNENVPSAVATLAVLRRAVGAEPGADPQVWSDTLGLVPDSAFDPRSDEPSAAELAAHHAMTLFALHRQGRVEGAHVDGTAPGIAFARAAWARRGPDGESEGVRRRFDAMVTAPTSAESAGHLRGLVQLLRAEDIGLDYGLLAEDLADLWSVHGQNRTRLRWARQYRAAAGFGEITLPGSTATGEDTPTALSTTATKE
ncbi:MULTISPECIES: type I-E CRISPR-associated protein Cse2/CasB [Miniimonas]|uniref:type I-E CRISPR-associated protein Cse2/CasB n=1 Tax=Miniimonas TaxID=947525 RepID=UPI00131F2F2B|nr:MULTISPECIES: type I-E CRISPR-associated protein Cse2/CasB [Miniimonas]